MASFLSRLLSLFKTKRGQANGLSISVDVMDKQFTVHSDNIQSSNERLANIHDRKVRRYRSHDRLMRHKKIWAVVSYVKTIEAIHKSNNFYDLDKAYLDHQNALARFAAPDYCPSENEFLCAFRFCDIQNNRGKCEHRLLEDEKQSISDWDNLTLDFSNILEAVSNRFIIYWDEALDTYKKKSAYLNRLDYIISHLNEVKYRNGLSMIPHIEEYVNKVQTHYIGLKSKQSDDNLSASKNTAET